MVMATPSPQQVGREFVRQYYTVLHEAPDMLHRFYSSGSTFVHGGVDRPGFTEEPVIGQFEIDKKIRLLNFKDCHTKIRQVDSQATIGSGVVVQVTGELSNNGEPMRRFMQTFVLAPQTPKKFYVHNDIFRYQDEVYQDNSDDEANVEEQVAHQQPEHEHHHVETQSTSTSTTTSHVPLSEQNGTSEQLNGHMHSSSSSASSASSSVETATKTTIELLNQMKLNDIQSEEVQQQQQPAQQHVETVTPTPQPAQQQQQQQPAEERKQEPIQQQQPSELKPSSWAKIISHKGGSSESLTNQQAPAQQQQQQSNQQQAKQRLDSLSNGPSLTTNVSTNGSNAPQNGTAAPTTKGKPSSGPKTPKSKSTSGSTSNAPRSSNVPSAAPTTTTAAPAPASTQATTNGNGSVNFDLDDEKRFGRYPDGQQVFVGNLNQDLTEPELRQYFGQYGKVVEVRINTNTKQQSGRRLPNYGFVVFDDKQAVENLLGSSKSNNLTYKNDKGVEYRLNVEEKRARQGRSFGTTTGTNGTGPSKANNRNARSSSNGSRGASNKKQPNTHQDGTENSMKRKSMSNHHNEHENHDSTNTNQYVRKSAAPQSKPYFNKTSSTVTVANK